MQPGRIGVFQLKGRSGHKLGLIEAALSAFTAVQGHGNYCNRKRGETRFQGGYRLSQHASKNVGRRAHAAILEKMDQLPQSAFITAISCGTREHGFDATAQTATKITLSVGECIRGEKPLAANRADSARDRLDRIQTFLANGKARNFC